MDGLGQTILLGWLMARWTGRGSCRPETIQVWLAIPGQSEAGTQRPKPLQIDSHLLLKQTSQNLSAFFSCSAHLKQSQLVKQTALLIWLVRTLHKSHDKQDDAVVDTTALSNGHRKQNTRGRRRGFCFHLLPLLPPSAQLTHNDIHSPSATSHCSNHGNYRNDLQCCNPYFHNLCTINESP